MLTSTPCPDLHAYRQLISGQLAADQTESLIRHLETCAVCAGKIQTLPATDTLIEWIRQAKSSTASPENKQLTTLMQRLIQLGKPAASSPSISLGPLTFACAGCGKRLRVKEQAAGKKVKCPHCGQVVQAPPLAEITVAPLDSQTSSPGGMETVDLPSVPSAVSNPGTPSGTPTLARREPSDKERELCAFLAPAQTADELGRLGPYRVLKVLGAGGMGVVFRAEDPQLQRPVALKAMLPALAANESARQRFLREARLAASLKHDRIVTIHQVGEDRGAPYLAMEFLEGESLEDRLKREGKLPLAEVLRIGREIAEGLQAAHERGLIHRDIKPANVWLEARPTPLSSSGRGVGGEGGRVKILDFGLARSSADEVHLTQSGAIVGTPAYMPPEQARGEAVDGRCDLYSLGCVLYRLSTGELPFKGDNTMSLLMALATEQPKSVRDLNPDVPSPLSELILRLLAKDAAQRPATAGEVAQALQDIAEAKSPLPTAVPAPTTPRRRRRLPWAVAGGALVLAAVLTIIVIRLGKPEEGTITIETVDPNVELVFTSGGQNYTVRDKKTGEEIQLPLGAYQVQIKGGKEELKLETNQFTLKRGERVLVKVTRQAGEKAAAARADIPGPVQIPEPLPLAEWLKGRKILTVSQDGKGQFKTIQAALDALKPHQVVKVLDRGPYRERLCLNPVLEDTGLVSETQTVLELAEWINHNPGHVSHVGHEFFRSIGFRMNGFAFIFPTNQKDGIGLHVGSPNGFVMENCCLVAPEKDQSEVAAGIIWGDESDGVGSAWVRDCLIHGRLHFSSGNPRAVGIAERNYLDSINDHNLGTSHAFEKLVFRHNVFGGRASLCDILISSFKEVGALEFSNNTLAAPRPNLFTESAPARNVTLRNNLRSHPGFFALINKAEKTLPEANQNWQVGHNGYPRELLGGEWHLRKEWSLAAAPSDVLAEPHFLSLDPKHPDFMRLPADSPLAKAGAGGAWPSYIGALPPGPAPKEGDWFTRLRQRWDNVAPANKPLSPPVQIPEPPPLAEWLKGRKVLTVSQDGKGQFKTIQAALDALKPHQVVKVLDRGPYRETLRLAAVPEDTGLIGEQNTIVELAKWESDRQWSEEDVGHIFEEVNGFRLSGFRFLAPRHKRHCYLTLWDTCPSGLVIEDCCFDPEEVFVPWPVVQPILLRFAGARFIKEPVVVRRCTIYGGCIHIEEKHPRAAVLVANNYFRDSGSIYCGSSRLQKLIIRHNVFDYAGPPLHHDGPQFRDLQGDETTLEISNNTIVCPGTRCKNGVPTGGVIVCNNILKNGFTCDSEDGARRLPQAARGWKVGYNCFLEYGKTAQAFVPKTATDRVDAVEFLSLDSSSPDYLRLPSDSPLAKGGAGGAWPSYIGALPPGPAPKDGDWFTRLRAKWGKDKPAAK